MVHNKVCKYCKENKPISEFHNSVNTKDGKHARCKVCINKKNAEWRERNPEKVAKSKKNYGLYHSEKIKEDGRVRRMDERFQSHMADYRRKWNLAKRYNITIDEYDSLYQKCGGKCEICQKPLNFNRGSKNMACVDHDHATGKVRGILCRWCNQAMGAFGDQIEGLIKAIDYLQRAKEKSR